MLEYLLELKGVGGDGGVGKVAAALLERVNLAHAARRKVKDYSGGHAPAARHRPGDRRQPHA